MSIALYKLMHLLGIFALLVALAGMGAHAATGQPKSENGSYRALLVFHGLGALLALVGGFGLLARLGLMADGGVAGWIWAKLVLWVVLGGLVALPYRRISSARPILLFLPFLGLLGALLANYKPF
jgi:uncharacterized membrane protein SirB2